MYTIGKIYGNEYGTTEHGGLWFWGLKPGHIHKQWIQVAGTGQIDFKECKNPKEKTRRYLNKNHLYTLGKERLR